MSVFGVARRLLWLEKTEGESGKIRSENRLGVSWDHGMNLRFYSKRDGKPRNNMTRFIF